jgi:type II secretory pathway component PulF
MPAFTAIIVDTTGKRRTLTGQAPDAGQFYQNLRAQNLWPLRIAAVRSSRSFARLTLSVRDFVELLNQLELQLRAGVTADAALTQLAADSPPRGRARRILEKIAQDVQQGIPIHTACRFFSKLFPGHAAAMIEAGESSAQLPATLRALVRHFWEMDQIRRTARRAIAYPAAVLTATTVLALFLLGGVIPRFAEIFATLHMQLPASTRGLIALSDFLRSHWPVLTAGGIATCTALVMFSRSAYFRSTRDAAFLFIPQIGDIIRFLATARFAANVGLLHEAGIPLLDALDTGAELTGHATLTRQIRKARAGVAAGLPLSAALPQGHDFPAFVVPTLRAGETSGQLRDALGYIETYAAQRAREKLLTALSLLEPVLVVVLTGVVGFIALSFFLPLFDLLAGFKSA